MRSLLGGAIAAGLLAGCGSDSTAPIHKIGLRIIAGADASDTIGAPLPQALIVEVRDPGGTVLRDAVVRFTALQDDSMPYATAIAVAPLTSAFFSVFTSDSTDTHGRASVLVELGTVVGKAGIAITVPELGLVDTAWYTVTLGRPSRFSLHVSDTLVTRGKSWDIGAKVMDRAGNPLPSDSVQYVSLNSSATVTTAGHITAVSEGRAEIDVQWGTAHDTARAGVVPPGSLVAVRPDNGVYVMNLDGSGQRELTAVSDYSVFPQWSPDGRRVTIYEGNPYGAVNFSAVALDGTRTRIVPSPGSLLGGIAWARPDASGLLYFAGPQLSNGAMTIWRMNADGSGLVKLFSPTDSQDFTHPAPSPDGKTVLYDVDQQGIMAIDVATNTVHALGLQGSFPVYSPDGAHIAYLSGSSLMVANSDGTGARALWNSSTVDVTSPSWSADGKWILAQQGGGGAALVRVADAAILPLPFAFGYFQFTMH